MNRLWKDLYCSWRHPDSRLNVTPQQIYEHLKVMRPYAGDDACLGMNDWIVSNLDTLDRKAQGLLLLSALVLAITALIFTRIFNDLGWAGLTALLVIIAMLVASCVQLAILNVAYWTSTHEFHAGLRAGGPPDAEELLAHLLEIREGRTRIIWRSCLWTLTSLVFIFFLAIAEAIMLATHSVPT